MRKGREWSREVLREENAERMSALKLRDHFRFSVLNVSIVTRQAALGCINTHTPYVIQMEVIKKSGGNWFLGSGVHCCQVESGRHPRSRHPSCGSLPWGQEVVPEEHTDRHTQKESH